MARTPPNSARAARRARRRRRRAIGLGVAAVVVVLPAAGAGAWYVTRSDEAGRVATPAVSRSTTSTGPTTTTTIRDPRRGNGEPVTLAFGGDVHFEGGLRGKLHADPAAVLAPIAPTLSAADVAVLNLETAVTEGGAPVPKKYNFRTPAFALDAMRAAGVDAVSVANNHGLDFGPQGLADTLAAAAEKQFPVLGIGNNWNEAFTPYRVDVRGQRITIFAATDVIDSPYETTWDATETEPGLASTKLDGLERMAANVALARTDSDTVVVFLHWGVERENCPSDRQREVAQVLTDAGADIVVGSHAHHLQGGGRFNTAFVDYGLGNFAFYNEQGEYGRTGVLMITATGRDVDAYQWVPAHITGGVATPVPPGPEADAEVAHWNELRACTGLAP
jgi:poly-gamma-glutamate synthesis protein (capsule biosynthesis protein)